MKKNVTISTIVELLRDRGLYQADQIAYTFLQDGEVESSRISYGELDRRSRAIASQLQSMGATGQRALLLYPSGLEFIAAFCGCLYAGVVAVPAYPPRANQKMSRLEAIVADAQARVILTTVSLLNNIKSRVAQNPELVALPCLATDNIDENQAESWQKTTLSESTLAFLQYTSGSTGTPKGAMVSHGNLLHNEKIIQKGFEHSSQSSVVGWLPLFHDMGLIGNVLQPLYVGIPCILMSPEAFLQRPLRWLQAISQYKATTSGGPNFAYDLCVSKITDEQRATLDLSSWQVAFSGAETVRAETMARFASAFADCGFRREAFYPCYGMAETTLIVSGGDASAQPVVQTFNKASLEKNRVVPTLTEDDDSQTVVGCGRALEDLEIVIANPQTMERCQPNEVGEIWVTGQSIAQGYWNRQEQTEETFRSQLPDTVAKAFLRTGDLGFLLNGELFVTGRLKDVIIIRGRNHYPQDIELTVEQSHPALRSNAGAAFSVDFAGEEKLVVVQEVERSYLRKLNANEVIGAIRRAVAEQHDLEVYAVMLLKTVSLPKTSSGKVQRSACRAGFLAGTLDVVADWSPNPQYQTKFRDLATEVESLLQKVQTAKLPPEESQNNHSHQQVLNQQTSHSIEAIEAWLISKVRAQLATSEEIDIRQPLVQYGLSSLAAVGISGDLQEWLGREISPTILYDYPTIESLAQHLGGLETGVNQPDAHSTLTTTEAIAIIGMGCRFPGATDPQTFWQLLHDGVDAIKEVPPSRWDNTADIQEIHTRWGGFLEQVDQFDPQFFGIAPREAELMDPQQRLLLEVGWEALENAGQTQQQLAGSQTGVFIGISNFDYSRLQFNHDVATDPYCGTGNAFSIAANRLSYVLDLRGPSWAVDTACSSSLVAVHQACQSLQRGECHLALAGGVNLILSPEVSVTFSKAGMMAVDGRCKTFDAKANGYVRGEGCGVVVLKRMSDALRDGDNILAVIKGSAVNQDGRSNGLTAPNALSQQAVIRQALENAQVQPAEISYVEAHGTGTSLGDPIEVNSLKDMLMQGRSPNQPCWIGSVKTNIGHLESASGIASLIKVVLCLQHKEIPPHLHLTQINPYIYIEGTPFSIPTQLQEWLPGKEIRLAGVSSFGFGGTNAHVVLEEAPTIASVETEIERPKHILTLSAKSELALQELAQRYVETLPASPLADICYTANTGRSLNDYRLAVVAESTVQLREQLQAFAANKETAHLRTQKPPRLAFLFTGQGSQYVGMGRELYLTQPTFRQNLHLCEEILRPYLQKPLLNVLYPEPGETSPIDTTAYTQPILFALEYALFQLWKSWGIEPTVVMGHSVGEYVAATVAGVFSLEDGLKLIAERGRLMQALRQDGEMVAVFADEATVTAAIQLYTLEVSIAALNGPQSVVVSGRQQAVNLVVEALKAQGVKTKKLNVSHAFHSPLMEPMLADFQHIAREVTYATPRIDLISNITGKLATAEIATPEYWCRHIRQPVRFAASMETLAQQGYEVFLECGAKPTLLGMGRQCLPDVETQRYKEHGTGSNYVFLPSLRQGQSEWQEILQSLGELYLRGIRVDWSGFDRDYPRRRLQLPTYPFQRKSYWVDVPNRQSPATIQTPLMNLISQGNTQQLIQDLETTVELSEDELKVLPKLLNLLVKQNQQQLLSASIKDWLYEIEWQVKPRQVETQEQNGFHKAGGWLIFADSEGVGKTLAKLLHSRGQTCILVYAGDTYQAKEAGTWSINPKNPADFEQLFPEVLGNLPLQGIVHLWSLEAELTSNLTISSLEQAQIGVNSVLYMLQALIKRQGEFPFLPSPRLWLLTRGAVPIDSNLTGVAQAPLWGLGKVVALEHPELWGGMLDLAPESTHDEATKLLAEIEDSFGEDHIAFRNGNRYVARLVPKQLPESTKKVALRSDGTYLITGGLGALGLSVARWMVEKGAGQLVLIGRRQASPEAQEKLRQLEQLGAKVVVAQADVSERGDMVRVLETIQTSMPPLMGIIHAAGVVGYEAIKDIAPDSLASVLRPKVIGTWILHHLTQEIKLDFFVSFSSIASVWGSKAQAHYAAANHFLDALAHYRQGIGLPAISVNWGPWAGGGMAVEEFQTQLSRMGVQGLQPEQAFAALESLLGANCTQATVANVDWSLFKELYELRGKRSLLELLAGIPPTAKLPQSAERSAILQQLQAAGASESPEERFHERISLLIAYIQGEVAKVLKLEPSHLPDPQQGFFDMGMDSLMAVEFKNRLEVSLETSVPVTLMFDFPTIKDLASYVAKEVMGWELPIEGDSELPREDELAEALLEVEELSEDKVDASIVEELAKLETFLRKN